MSIPASEEFKLTAIRDMREGDIIIDPADEAGWTTESHSGRSIGHSGQERCGWIGFRGSRQFYSYRPPKEEQ